jgi:hypothetical protein
VEDPRPQRSVEQRLIDGLLPEEMDWEDVVRTYPLTSVTLAAVAGFLIGSRRGRAILGTVTESALDRVSGMVHELVDR